MTAVVTRTVWGMMLVPPNDQYVATSLIRTGQFSPLEFDTWRPYLEREGCVVLDVGANLGGHTIPFSAVVAPLSGMVHAFEPQRELFHMLCGSIALCDATRWVIARNLAIGREKGMVRIPLLDYGAPANYGGMDLRTIPKEAPCELIPLVPIDSMNLERVDFIKIDVEGMELDVLHGAEETVTRCRPVICCEADREQNVAATLAWFRLHNYRTWWHEPPLGPLFMSGPHYIVSKNLMALPRERLELPEPSGYIKAIDDALHPAAVQPEKQTSKLTLLIK